MPNRGEAVCVGATLMAVGTLRTACAAEFGTRLDSHSMLLMADLVGALAFAIAMAALYLRGRRRAASLRRESEARIARLRAERDEAEALLDREGEIAVLWSGSDAPAIKGDLAFAKA